MLDIEHSPATPLGSLDKALASSVNLAHRRDSNEPIWGESPSV